MEGHPACIYGVAGEAQVAGFRGANMSSCWSRGVSEEEELNQHPCFYFHWKTPLVKVYINMRIPKKGSKVATRRTGNVEEDDPVK